ncbi:MAG: ribonuclease E/G [Rhodospirillaceae bacterium]
MDAGCRVLVARHPGETRWALLAPEPAQGQGPAALPLAELPSGERVLALRLVRDHRLQVGEIHLGRVGDRLPGHEAAFVALAAGPDGLLDARDAPQGLPPQGALVLVEVKRAAIAEKGPRLSTAVTLAGRLVTLGRGRPGSGLSPRIGPAARRKALSALLKQHCAEQEALVARTAAAAAADTAILDELVALRARFTDLEARAASAKEPCCLWGGPTPAELWQAHWPVSEIQAEGLGAAWRASLPEDLQERVTLRLPRTDQGGLFDETGLSELLDQMAQTDVELPGGGAVRVEVTSALWALDVDARRCPPGQAAQEAVAALPDLLRLFDLRGQILIDPPRGPKGQPDRRLEGQLRGFLASQPDAQDPSSARLLGATPGGLLELRRGGGYDPLPVLIRGTEHQILRALALVTRSGAPGAAGLRLGTLAHGLLTRSLSAAKREAEQRLGTAIALHLDPALPEGHVSIS